MKKIKVCIQESPNKTEIFIYDDDNLSIGRIVVHGECKDFNVFTGSDSGNKMEYIKEKPEAITLDSNTG